MVKHQVSGNSPSIKTMAGVTPKLVAEWTWQLANTSSWQAAIIRKKAPRYSVLELCERAVFQSTKLNTACLLNGGDPRVVSTAVCQARARGSVAGLGGLKETKMFILHPLLKLV